MYNKLFSKIVDSSIWMEPDHVRLVWMMFIAIMDEDGFVNLASVKNVAHRAVMDLDKAENAIEVLESPDPDSSNPDHEGRRLTRTHGGWLVNNAKEYREIVKREHQKELNRERVRRHRSKLCNGSVMVVNENVTPSEAEAEAEAEVNTLASARTRSRFIEPSVEEVRAYVANSNLSNVEADRFHDYYTANGWKQGGGKPIKDWRAACRNWDRRQPEFSRRGSPGNNRRNQGAVYDPTLTKEKMLEGFK